jgi:hypothetical protein
VELAAQLRKSCTVYGEKTVRVSLESGLSQPLIADSTSTFPLPGVTTSSLGYS